MKLMRFLCFLALGGIGFLLAAETPAGPASPYERAVKVYVEAATNEVQAMHRQVDALCHDATPETKTRYAGVYAKLELCEKLLADLRSAAPADFDRIKEQYERERANLGKARVEADRPR